MGITDHIVSWVMHQLHFDCWNTEQEQYHDRSYNTTMTHSPHLYILLHIYALELKKQKPRKQNKISIFLKTQSNHCLIISATFIIFCCYTSFALKYNEAFSHIDCPFKNKSSKMTSTTCNCAFSIVAIHLCFTHILWNRKLDFCEWLLRMCVNAGKEQKQQPANRLLNNGNKLQSIKNIKKNK